LRQIVKKCTETGECMRVFISVDIEGISGVNQWSQTEQGGFGYEAAARQMSLEAAAACDGAKNAGAEKIRVRDAHGKGFNIDAALLPKGVEITRGFNGSPWSMVDTITDGFDAAVFVGYHCAAGRNGNPLCHTEEASAVYVTVNGEKISEFHTGAWACASIGIPVVFIAGDEAACKDAEKAAPGIVTVPVKKGLGSVMTCLQPEDACDRIREGVERALRTMPEKPLVSVPKHFFVEICYKEAAKAARMANFPGFRLMDDQTITMETDELFDVLTAFQWVL